tara:strand:+ start:256 stop:450 length:195 start_codon:yes stop_codon:yes gene_type:complete
MVSLAYLIIIELGMASTTQIGDTPIMWLNSSALAEALRPHPGKMRSDNAALCPGATIDASFIPR